MITWMTCWCNDFTNLPYYLRFKQRVPTIPPIHELMNWVMWFLCPMAWLIFRSLVNSVYAYHLDEQIRRSSFKPQKWIIRWSVSISNNPATIDRSSPASLARGYEFSYSLFKMWVVTIKLMNWWFISESTVFKTWLLTWRQSPKGMSGERS
jgi:hypothetical protein